MTGRTQAELVKELGDQQQFLRDHGALFDDGREAEAKHLAVTIRLLVHETRNSHALLGEAGLDVLANTMFLDTAGPLPSSEQGGMQVLLAFRPGLFALGLSTNGEANYAPMLRSGEGDWVSFDAWWRDPVTATPRTTRRFARRQYVLALANREGGAHLDPSMDELYAALTVANELDVQIQRDGSLLPPASNPVYAAVRQIAFELETTLDTQLGNWLSEPD